MRLRDKVIIVTGSTSGIGQAIAERAVHEGARVLIHGIDGVGGKKVVAKLGASAALHLDDLVDPECAPRIVAAAIQADIAPASLMPSSRIWPLRSSL